MYICYRITSYIHDNQDKCVEQALRILNSMDTTNNVFAQITITKLNKSIYLASDTTKTALGISSNIFELDSLTTDKDLVNNAISSSNAIASGTYDKLLNSSNVVLKDNIKTINGQSLIGTGDITITGGGSVDLSNYYDKTNIDTKLNAKLDTATANSTYATKTELGTKLDANTEFKTINGQAIKGTGNIEITGNVDLTGFYTKEAVDEKLDNKLDTTGLKTINGNSLVGTGDISIAKKAISKYIVIGITGQSNSVGYDESPLTPYDVPADSERIFQYSTSLKPLTYCAECFQNMNTIRKRQASNANMATDRANEFGHTADRNTYVMTKGIHLPLANLIINSIPEDYGVIIVPGSYGGKRISEFMPGKEYYTNFINRLKGALDLPGSVFAGIIWSQGEHDAQAKMNGTEYLNSLKTLISSTNTALASYTNRSIKGSITEKDWYFFDWPKYFKDRDTGNILVELRKYFGDRYVEIPLDTPVNLTDYTSSIKEAHYGQNSFRTIIAPRVFKAMSEGNCFLVTDYDKTGGTSGVTSEELANALATKANTSDIDTYKQEVQTKLDAKLDLATKFKTINGQEIKGDGNIAIEINGGDVDLSGYCTKTELNTQLATKAPLDGFTQLQQEVTTKYATALTDVRTKLYFVNMNNSILSDSLRSNPSLSVDTSIPIPQDTVKMHRNFKVDTTGITYIGDLGTTTYCMYSPENYNTLYYETNLQKTVLTDVQVTYGVVLARNTSNNKYLWLFSQNGKLFVNTDNEAGSSFTPLNTTSLWDDNSYLLAGVGQFKFKRIGTRIEIYKIFETRFLKIAELDIASNLSDIDITSPSDSNLQMVWGIACGWSRSFDRVDQTKGYWHNIRLDNDGNAYTYLANPWRPLMSKDIDVLSNATLDTTGSIKFAGNQLGKVILKRDVSAFRYTSAMNTNAGLYISPTFKDQLDIPRGIATETNDSVGSWHTFTSTAHSLGVSADKVTNFFTHQGTFEVEYNKGWEGSDPRKFIVFTRVRDNATFYLETPSGNGWHRRLGFFTRRGSGSVSNIMVKDY